MKKIICCVFVLSLCLFSAFFSYAENDSKNKEASFEKEILKNDEKNSMLTDDLLTRAEMMVIMYHLSGIENEIYDLESLSTFEDTEGHWAENYIIYAELAQWTNGHSMSEFRPDQRLTKAEFSEFILRYLGYHSAGTDEWKHAVEDIKELGINIEGEKLSTEEAFMILTDLFPANKANNPQEIIFVEGFVTDDKTIQIEFSEALMNLEKLTYQLKDEVGNEISIDRINYTPWDTEHTELFVHLNKSLLKGKLYTLYINDATIEVTYNVKESTGYNQGENSLKEPEILLEKNILKNDDIYERLIDDTITRAEMMLILCRLNGTEDKAYEFSLLSSFEDAEDHWAENYIAYAELQQWTNGYSKTEFKPDQKLTKIEFAEFILRFLGYHSIGTNEWQNSKKDLEVLGIDYQDNDFSTENFYEVILQVFPLIKASDIGSVTKDSEESLMLEHKNSIGKEYDGLLVFKFLNKCWV